MIPGLPRRLFLSCVLPLVGTGLLAACAAGAPLPIDTATALPAPLLSPVPTIFLPSITESPSLTPSPWPMPSRPAAPTITILPSPTLEPTGIFPEGYPAGQNPYRAVVSYPGVFNERMTRTIHFLLYLPASFGKDPARRWPLLIYLHGSGERGNNLALVQAKLLPQFLNSQPDFPFIVLSPQCPANYATWSAQIDTLNALIDQILARYPVDPKRITLSGFSMGGFGAWEFALRYPQRFAAIAPVAGGYLFQSDALPPNLCDLKDLPVWVFHGGQDTSVPPEQDISLVNALKACQGHVHLTYYPDANHMTTAERAYSTPELFQWLAAQSRP